MKRVVVIASLPMRMAEPTPSAHTEKKRFQRPPLPPARDADISAAGAQWPPWSHRQSAPMPGSAELWKQKHLLNLLYLYSK